MRRKSRSWALQCWAPSSASTALPCSAPTLTKSGSNYLHKTALVLHKCGMSYLANGIEDTNAAGMLHEISSKNQRSF